MRLKRILVVAAPVLWAVCACQEKPQPVEPVDVSAWKGLVINEIAAHDQTVDAVTKVELLNAGSTTMDLSGLGLYITDEYFTGQSIWAAPAGTRRPRSWTPTATPSPTSTPPVSSAPCTPTSTTAAAT